MFAGILNQIIVNPKVNHLQRKHHKTNGCRNSGSKTRFKSKAIKCFAGIFTARSNKGTVQINERTHSLSINSNQTSRRLHGNKSLQCSSTLVQGFREFKPFRENLDITMHRYELPIGNNSFDKHSP